MKYQYEIGLLFLINLESADIHFQNIQLIFNFISVKNYGINL